MTLVTPEARAYIDRLRDLLPARDAERVVKDVEALILDRVEAAPQDDAAAAERKALAHLGAPESLADTLAEPAWSVGASVRRSFARWWAVLLAGHLLLSILLAVGGAEAAALPGLLAPLTRWPWWGTLTSVAGIALLDAGIVFLVFTLRGAWSRAGGVPALALTPSWTRADALRELVLLALVALIAHPLRDEIFSVRRGGDSTPFLAPDLVALLPWLDAVLGLVALRCALVLAGWGSRTLTLAVDALAGVGGVALLVLAATRGELVRLPTHVLGAETAGVLASLITRALMVVFVLAALLLAVSVAKRLLAVKRAATA